jgi:hypothetical protein
MMCAWSALPSILAVGSQRDKSVRRPAKRDEPKSAGLYFQCDAMSFSEVREAPEGGTL